MPELAAFMSLLGDKNTTVLKLAMDSINLGLGDSHDYFSCSLIIVQTNYILTFKEENSTVY